MSLKWDWETAVSFCCIWLHLATNCCGVIAGIRFPRNKKPPKGLQKQCGVGNGRFGWLVKLNKLQ